MIAIIVICILLIYMFIAGIFYKLYESCFWGNIRVIDPYEEITHNGRSIIIGLFWPFAMPFIVGTYFVRKYFG